VKLTIRLLKTNSWSFTLTQHKFANLKSLFSSILFLYLVRKNRVDSETDNLKNVRRL
jgi:hypothetical protein